MVAARVGSPQQRRERLQDSRNSLATAASVESAEMVDAFD
jgi:hypothetical protein